MQFNNRRMGLENILHSLRSKWNTDLQLATEELVGADRPQICLVPTCVWLAELRNISHHSGQTGDWAVTAASPTLRALVCMSTTSRS